MIVDFTLGQDHTRLLQFSKERRSGVLGMQGFENEAIEIFHRRFDGGKIHPLPGFEKHFLVKRLRIRLPEPEESKRSRNDLPDDLPGFCEDIVSDKQLSNLRTDILTASLIEPPRLAFDQLRTRHLEEAFQLPPPSATRLSLLLKKPDQSLGLFLQLHGPMDALPGPDPHRGCARKLLFDGLQEAVETALCGKRPVRIA
ncbi:MAG: hypothetical protein C4530_23355 [Desulfobacteraceae bacterium]|nr:MAG: hypothetical protein C4530_23355 [Desulfobacteraceae bacterium]